MDDLRSAQHDSAPEAPAPSRGKPGRWLAVAVLALLALAATVTAAAVFGQDSKASWQLVWSDDFNGSTLDESKWNAEDHSTFGEGNLELACLMKRSKNVEVAGGMLTLRAARENPPVICGDKDSRFPRGRSYTSAMLSTEGKAAWHHGRFEMRAKLPLAAGKSKGLWPAFWMRPANGSGDGELDIMEAIGTGDSQDPEAGSVHHTLWYDGKGTFAKQSYSAPVKGGPASGFHTYAAEWQSGVVRWYVDGQLTFERDRANAPWIDEAFAGEFFLRLNLAVGGRWPGSPNSETGLPADMVVDWVKVSQWR
ncbi:MAG TPA: glycoside hydrolase family 16 protein [Jatrophihabitans sp.]|jgi:beta-glucanase (GH16 family)|uniref:glycoside hydrolase family 16 protein n=1 Tax=Jatrophihabitans sp. TaxID=1932789 RepID=UPI002EFA4A69